MPERTKINLCRRWIHTEGEILAPVLETKLSRRWIYTESMVQINMVIDLCRRWTYTEGKITGLVFQF